LKGDVEEVMEVVEMREGVTIRVGTARGGEGGVVF